MVDFRSGLRGGLLAATLLLNSGAMAGDLGRRAPDVISDQVLPAIGKLRGWVSGDPASDFNRSDDEKLLDNRLARFLSSVRQNDWAYDIVAELFRSRILLRAEIPGFGTDRYYNGLHDTDYRSSNVRYAVMSDDVGADLATLPDTFRAICAVQNTDRQRAIAFAHLPNPDGAEGSNLNARFSENRYLVDWFINALDYRYQSYSYALDHLLVETPDAAARGVNLQLEQLERFVLLGEHGHFCGGSAPLPHAGNPSPGAPVIPSRILKDTPQPPTASRPVGS